LRHWRNAEGQISKLAHFAPSFSNSATFDRAFRLAGVTARAWTSTVIFRLRVATTPASLSHPRRS
jgi:hypothetical protein